MVKRNILYYLLNWNFIGLQSTTRVIKCLYVQENEGQQLIFYMCALMGLYTVLCFIFNDFIDTPHFIACSYVIKYVFTHTHTK